MFCFLFFRLKHAGLEKDAGIKPKKERKKTCPDAASIKVCATRKNQKKIKKEKEESATKNNVHTRREREREREREKIDEDAKFF